MAASPIFTQACSQLEETTDLSTIEARGTVRLALKSAGLEAASVTLEQMTVVLTRVMPEELAARGVDDPAAVSASIASALGRLATNASANITDTPDAIFERLGSSSRE
ncbi:MAG: hypothetical protein AB8G23_02730 [Myxococcota bacterium]